MCLLLPAKVLAVNDDRAEIELHGGARVTVSTALKDGVTAGQFVLVDRGVIVEEIADEEARTIIAMYAEIGDLLEQENP